MVVTGWSVHRLGPGDIAYAKIGARSAGGLVEVWWSRVTVTVVGFGCSCILIISCS